MAIPPPPPADLRVTASFDRLSLEVGTRAALRFTITNGGPYRGSRMQAVVKAEPLALLPASGPAWSCAPHVGGFAVCSVDWFLDVGQSVTIEIPLFAQTGSLASAEVSVDFVGSSADPRQDDNHATATAPLTSTTRQVDLSIDIDEDPASPIPFGPQTRVVSVANAGPRVANDVIVYVAHARAFTAASRSGEWTCTEGNIIACTYARPLGSGRSAELPLEVRPPFTGVYDATATVAGSGGEEARPGDNTASFRSAFGVASDFEPVLVPYLAWEVRGAMGSRWSNEVAMYTSKLGVAIHSAPCAGTVTALSSVTVLWPVPTCSSQPQGALFYVPKADRGAVTFSSHLFEHDFLAAELPVIDGSRFKKEIHLPRLDLRRAGSARFAIRVYAVDAEPGQWVLVDTAPRLFQYPPLPNPPLQRQLARVSEERNELGMPIHPAFAEFSHDDVLRQLPLNRDPVTLVVYSERPVWAMLVIVDNATQRPVFLTPQ